MRSVSIIGTGQTRVGERWDCSLRDLAVEASLAALKDAGNLRPQALVVGSMMSGQLNSQEALGALFADALGMAGIECYRLEAACASSAAALRVGSSLIAAGQFERVLVVGVEKMTDRLPHDVNSALATAADADTETIHGATFAAMNAMLMRLYMEKYGLPDDALAGFPIAAHEHALHNAFAMFRRRISRDEYLGSDMVASPLRMLDSAPVCDGAAAVLLAEKSTLCKLANKPVHILGSAVSTDRLTLASRPNPLHLVAAQKSTASALAQANRRVEEIAVLELHDAFSILTALSLEAIGLSQPGKACEWATESRSRPCIASMGGLKARGHPVGASGLYQIADACAQLRGEAGMAQVEGARVALTQNFGGLATTAITHILGIDD